MNAVEFRFSPRSWGDVFSNIPNIDAAAFISGDKQVEMRWGEGNVGDLGT